MLKIALSGCCGRMGHVINDIVSGREGMEIVAGFDINTVQYADFPIFADPFEFTGECDVIIDFSNAASTERLLDYCEQHGTPVVICTTGYSAAQLDRIRAASAKIAVFRSGNMSLGINLMSELLKQSAAVLGDKYDVEIIEKHHNQKLDAPSGTALMLADAVASALPLMMRSTFTTVTSAAKSVRHTRSVSPRSAAAPSLVSTACCSAAAMRSSRLSTPLCPARFSQSVRLMQPLSWPSAPSRAYTT